MRQGHAPEDRIEVGAGQLRVLGCDDELLCVDSTVEQASPLFSIRISIAHLPSPCSIGATLDAGHGSAPFGFYAECGNEEAPPGASARRGPKSGGACGAHTAMSVRATQGSRGQVEAPDQRRINGLVGVAPAPTASGHLPVARGLGRDRDLSDRVWLVVRAALRRRPSRAYCRSSCRSGTP